MLTIMTKSLCIFLLLPLSLLAQTKRIQPGKIYEPGDALYAPMFGFRATVPSGYIGSLPRESEVFLLTSQTSPTEIFVLARQGTDLISMKKGWESGFDLTDQIRLKAKAATIANGVLSSEVVAEGNYINKSMRAYAAARCGDSGACITCLGVVPSAQYDELKKAVDAFLSTSTFEPTSSASPYSDFVWKDFLTNQMVTTYAFLEKGSKETSIHLCADGRFTAKVTKKGILKNHNPQYNGKLTGTWKVEGVGEKGILQLTFDKALPALTAELLIHDEKITSGGDRYFVAVSDQCK